VEDTRSQIKASQQLSKSEKAAIEVTGYGHIGDGNVHLNVCTPGYDNHDLRDRLSNTVN
jgi:hypothetical protein